MAQFQLQPKPAPLHEAARYPADFDSKIAGYAFG
jgi:hypothetical protein